MGGMPELPPHRVARWAASVLICATLVVAGVVVSVQMAGVAHADSGDRGDQGSGDGGHQGSGDDGDQGSGDNGDSGDCGHSCGGGNGPSWAGPQQTPDNPAQVDHAPEALQVPLPAPAAPQVPLPAPAAPQVPLPTPAAPQVPLPAPVAPHVPHVPHVPLPAPGAPPASSHQRLGAPPAPASKPVGGLQPPANGSPAPAPTPVVVQQPAPAAPHAVRAPAAGTHRAAHRTRPRAQGRRRRQAAPVTALVTPLRKEPPTGAGQPARPLLDGAAVAPAGDQPELSLLVALPAIALLLPLFVLFLRRRRS
jgi:hypothetical protein